MAEIRVREATPQLIKQMGEIMLDVKEATIAGALAKSIPRYFDMKKRIIEQNEEIAKLTRELREYQNRIANAGSDITDFIIDSQNFGKDLARHLKVLEKRALTFGTKKRLAPGAARSGGGKNVPSKKKGGKK